MVRLSTEARRAQLLGVGRTVFAAQPYDQVSMDGLAAAAGVSKGLVYHYFQDKRSFYGEVLRQVAEEVVEVTALDGAVDPQQALGQSIARFIAYVRTNEPFYRALVRGGVGSDRSMEAVVEPVRRVTVNRVIEVLSLSADPTLETVIYGWVGFTEFSLLDWLDRQHLSADALGVLLLNALQSLVVAR